MLRRREGSEEEKIQQAAGAVEETKVAPPLPADPSHGDDAPGSGHKLKKKKSAAAESITAATAPMSPNSAPVVKQEKDENKKSKTATYNERQKVPSPLSSPLLSSSSSQETAGRGSSKISFPF
jgi:hypothetical protein